MLLRIILNSKELFSTLNPAPLTLLLDANKVSIFQSSKHVYTDARFINIPILKSEKSFSLAIPKIPTSRIIQVSFTISLKKTICLVVKRNRVVTRT